MKPTLLPQDIQKICVIFLTVSAVQYAVMGPNIKIESNYLAQTAQMTVSSTNKCQNSIERLFIRYESYPILVTITFVK